MVARVTTTMNTTPEALWEEIIKPGSLQYVAAPVLYFIPAADTELTAQWQVDKEYNLKLFFHKVVPLGDHRIILKKIDTSANEIASNESGKLARVWNHTIQFTSINSCQIEYTDTVEIKAGFLTPFIWLFSQVFYRHRQRRWKRFMNRA